MDDNVEDIEFDLDEEDGSDNNDVEVDVIDVIESDAGVDDDDDDDDENVSFFRRHRIIHTNTQSIDRFTIVV